MRSADAIEDPYATGMTFVTPAAAETDGDAPIAVEDEQVAQPVDQAEQADATEDLDASSRTTSRNSVMSLSKPWKRQRPPTPRHQTLPMLQPHSRRRP